MQRKGTDAVGWIHLTLVSYYWLAHTNIEELKLLPSSCLHHLHFWGVKDSDLGVQFPQPASLAFSGHQSSPVQLAIEVQSIVQQTAYKQ